MDFKFLDVDDDLIIEAFKRIAIQSGAVLAINVDVGLGKTDVAIRAIPILRQMAEESLAEIEQSLLKITDTSVIELLKKKQAKLKNLKRIVFAVPQHRLGNEIVPRCQDVGLTAAVFRGRLADNPNAPGQCMCLKPEEVKKITETGLSVSETMCINLRKEAQCDLFHSCPYQAQINIVSNADVAVVPHASLFHAMPNIGDRGTLIIDETFIFSGLRGVADTGVPLLLSLDELRLNTDTVYHKGEVDQQGTDELHRIRSLAADAIEQHPVGHLERGRLKATEWTKKIDKVITHEWGTVSKHTIWPGMPKNQFWAVIRSIKGTRGRQKRILFWRSFHALVSHKNVEKSGWLIRTEDDDGNPAVEIRIRENIKRGWCEGAVVTLDATPSTELTKHYFQNRKLLTEPVVAAKMEFVRVLQTVDKSFSASSIISNDGLSDNEQRRRKNRAREVWRWIILRAIEFRGFGLGGIDVLVVCQLGLEKMLVEWRLPKNVEVVHFNAIRGLDRWGGVRCNIVIGRTVPAPTVVEAIAETITGAAVAESVGDDNGEWWYPKSIVGIHIEGGEGWPVNVDRHPDAVAEAVRKQICDAEIIQAFGRGRGVNRTAGNPLQIDILTNVCLPLVVHEPIRWEHTVPGKIEEMICMGLLPASYAAAAMIYPEIWSSEDAARKAVHRTHSSKQLGGAKSGQNPYVCSTWDLSGFSTGAARRMAQARATIHRPQKRALRFDFLFDEHQIPQPELWLKDRIGMEVEVEF